MSTQTQFIHGSYDSPRGLSRVFAFVASALLAFSLVPGGAALADEEGGEGADAGDVAAATEVIEGAGEAEAAAGVGGGAAATDTDGKFVPDATYGAFPDHLKLQLFDRQQLLNLPTNTSSYYFKIPSGIVLQNPCSVSLYLTSSETLIEELSAITVSVNGNQLDTIPIKSIGEGGNGWWEVSVPVAYFMTGAINELRFTTAHRSIEGECADIDNPSNWVGIEAPSFLYLSVAQYPALTLANTFSTFYDSVLTGDTLTSQYVLPENGTSAVLEGGALTLASAAGAYRTGMNTINFSATSGLPSDDTTNSVFLGWQNGWSAFFGEPLQQLSAGQGYLASAGSLAEPGGSKLLVSGADDKGIERAVELAASSAYFEQLSGTTAVVTSDLERKHKVEVHDNGVYTFEDLGFNTLSLAGAFHQTASFNVSQPNNTQSGPASTVTINFSHSKALQADRSLLTVLIDNVEIDSIQLSDSNATNGSITVPIPQSAREKASFNVTVSVYNYIGKVDCSKDYYDVAWTVIDKSSSVFFDANDTRLRPVLSEFLQFNLWKETADSKLVVRSSELSSTALNLAARAGQRNGTSFSMLRKSLTDPLTDVDKNNNMIYVGSTSELVQLPHEVREALMVAPDSNDTFAIADEAPFINETLAGKVIVQVVRSPWNYDKYIYVLSYPEGSEARAAAVVADNDLMNALAGTISTVGADDSIASYDPLTKTEGDAPLTYETVQYRVHETFGIPLWAFVGGIVLLLLLVVLAIRLARRRSQFKQMERKMKEANQELDEEGAEPSSESPTY